MNESQLSQNPNSPAYESKAYSDMASEMQIVRDFCAGLTKVRSKGKTYLRQFPAEKREAYEYRLAQGLIFNDTERTLQSLVGRVFRKEPTLGEDVPVEISGQESTETERGFQIGDQVEVKGEPHMPGQTTGRIALVNGSAYGIVFDGMPGVHKWYVAAELAGSAGENKANGSLTQGVKVEGWAENIDLAGSHWTVFAKEVFTDAMRDGHAFILVDMPPALTEGATLADERATGRRPYWVRYTKDQAINWASETINGRQRLTQITFKECTVERDGDFGEKEVERYRVLRPGSYQLWKKVKGKDGKETLVPDGEGPTSLNEIPLAVIYSNRTGFLQSKPPLEPLAQIECARYNKYSDLSTGLHLTIPVLCRKGANPSKPVTQIGWHTIFDVNENGNVWYAESNGNGLEPMRMDIEALDQRMAVFGLSVLAKQQAAPTTATEALLTNVKEDSPLATAAQSLKDGLEAAFGFMTGYQKSPGGGSVKLGVLSRELAPLDAQAVTALSSAATNGQLSKETFLAILKEAGWTPEAFDVAQEVARITEQKKALPATPALSLSK